MYHLWTKLFLGNLYILSLKVQNFKFIYSESFACESTACLVNIRFLSGVCLLIEQRGGCKRHPIIGYGWEVERSVHTCLNTGVVLLSVFWFLITVLAFSMIKDSFWGQHQSVTWYAVASYVNWWPTFCKPRKSKPVWFILITFYNREVLNTKHTLSKSVN